MLYISIYYRLQIETSFIPETYVDEIFPQVIEYLRAPKTWNTSACSMWCVFAKDKAESRFCKPSEHRGVQAPLLDFLASFQSKRSEH